MACPATPCAVAAGEILLFSYHLFCVRPDRTLSEGDTAAVYRVLPPRNPH